VYRKSKDLRAKSGSTCTGKTATEARFGSATQRTAEYATQRDRVQRALSEALKQGSFASIEDLSAALLGKEEEEALEKELNDWKESLSALQSLHAEQGRVLKELENRKVVQRTSLGLPSSPVSEENEDLDYSKVLQRAIEDESTRKAEAEAEKERAMTDLATLNQESAGIYEEAENRRKTLAEEAELLLRDSIQ